MISSAVFMALTGIILSFMPAEVLATFGQAPNPILILLLQLTGGLYFGFAMTNWMAKNVLIGGIYSKPLSVGNFAHFFIAGLALAKSSISGATSSIYIVIFTFVYLLFAIAFGYISFTHPVKKQKHQP